MRILNEQWERLSRAVGNVFMPILAKILPYLNAILMVLTEIINTIASLLGFNLDEFDYFAGPSDSVQELEDNLGGATAGVSKLKKEMSGLRSFDKLNVVSTPKDSGGAGSGAGASGIDPRIMDEFNKSFKEYNDQLTEVQMKATKIRDKIMEWLGFTKVIDEKTKKVSFKFDHISKGLVIISSVLGLGVVGAVTKIYKLLKKIGFIDFGKIGKIFSVFSKSTGISSLGEGFKVLISGAGTLKEVFGVYILPVLQKLGGIGLIIGGIVKAFQGIFDLLDKTKSKFDGISKIIEGIALGVGGVAVLLGAWPVAIIAGIVLLGTKLTQFVVHHWDEIKTKLIDPIVKFVNGIATKVYDKAIKPIVEFLTPIIDTLKEAFHLIVDKVVEIYNKIKEIVTALWEAFKTYIVKPIHDFISSIIFYIEDKFINPIRVTFNAVGSWVYDHIISPVLEKVKWLKDKVVGLFKDIGTTIVNFISNSIKSVINGILSSLERKINSFIKLLNKAIKIINKIPGISTISYVDKIHLPRLQKGKSFVPNDYYGPVYLDYGERVLTKDENKSYSGNKNGSTFGNGNNPLNATFIIKVGDEQVAKQVLKNLQETAKTNGKPITITG